MVMALSFLLWAGVAAYGFYADANHVLGVRTVGREEWTTLQAQRRRVQTDAVICFEGEKLPYVRELGGYLITQSMDTPQWQGNLTLEQPYEMCVLAPESSKEEVISSGLALELMIYDDSVYETVYVTVSGLPVICINKQPDSPYQYSGMGELLVLEHDALGRENVIDARRYAASYRRRGGSSSVSEKPSLKINLFDHRGGKRSEQLLGMRADNDWIVNPLFTDSSNMRERLAYDFYRQMDGPNAHDGAYFELVFGDSYMGICMLMEVVDYDTFASGAHNSVVFSIKDWRTNWPQNETEAENAVETLLSRGYAIDEFTVDQYGALQPKEIIELLRALKAEICQWEDPSPYEIVFDEESYLRHALVINMTQAWDNGYKNQKFAMKKTGERRYVVAKTPWDLDVSMKYPEWIVEDTFISGEKPDENLKVRMKELYWQYRESFYHLQAIEEMIDANAAYLIRSGADGRERMRWNEPPFEAACDFLKSFFRERIEVLDAYYGG